MERRSILRVATLMALGLASEKYDALAQGTTPNGALTCDLNRWKWLVFTHSGKQVTIPMTEVFAALDEAYGSTKVR